MREMSDKGRKTGKHFAIEFDKKLFFDAIPEYAKQEVRTDDDRLYVIEKNYSEAFKNEYRYKEDKINATIANIKNKLAGKRKSTIHGINTCRPKYNKKSTGNRMETKALLELAKIGYEIEPCKTIKKQLHDCITVAGTPDGYISRSKIRSHIGMYVEIKSKPYSKLTRCDISQVYCYWFLTGRPVLLVNYYKNTIDLRIYTEAEMKMGWRSLSDRLICNAKRLSDLINFESYKEYLKFHKLMDGGDLYRLIRF
jgi:hypothetical protein